MTGLPPGAPEPPEEQPAGRLRPTSAAVLSLWGGVGLVGGWLLRPAADALGGTAPLVSWTQPLALLLVAAVLAGTARLTWRAVHVRHERLEPHRAVNRLVLARACALVGALVAGGYGGYAVSWLGIGTELVGERVWRSLAAAVAGVAVVATALLLERACRVPSDDAAP